MRTEFSLALYGTAARRSALPCEIVLERLGVFAGVFQRLAECEFEMEAVVGREVGPPQQAAHRLDLAGGEAEGLEVGQAPVGLAEARIEFDAPAVGLDGAFLVPAVFSAWP